VGECNEAGGCERLKVARIGQGIYLFCEGKVFIKDKAKVVRRGTGVTATAVNFELLLETDDQESLENVLGSCVVDHTAESFYSSAVILPRIAVQRLSCPLRATSSDAIVRCCAGVMHMLHATGAV